MKKVNSILLICLMIVLIALNSIASEDWPMFHHDLALSGYTNSYAPNTNDILWTYQSGGAIGSSPAMVDDKVYIGSQDGNLYCINKYTGTLIWTFLTNGIVQSSPAVSNGKVYFLSSDGTIYSLNANDGTLIWSTLIGPGPYDWASPAVHDGNVFIASSIGKVYSLDVNTGTVNWSTFIGGSPDSPITVVNGKVYSGTHNFDNSSPTLVALDEATGNIIWTYDYYLFHSTVVGMVNSNGAAVVDGDEDGDLEVYFGVYNWEGIDNQAVCLDEATGVEVWTQNINGNSTSTPAVHNGKVFIGSDDGNLYALDASDGSYVWSYQTNDQVWSAPAVSGDGKVCFGSLDHTIYCLDENTGNLIWSYFTGASRLVSSPAISDGILVVGNENGKVYAFGHYVPKCIEDDSGALDIPGTRCGQPIRVRIQNGPNDVASLGLEVVFPDQILTYTGFTRGPLVEDFDFFDCAIPAGEDNIVRCGGFKATGGIAAGASGDVVSLEFDANPEFDGIAKIDLQELKDDIAGWSTSHGCFDCTACDCDVSGDGEVTPKDALCAFQKYLGINPTDCGPVEEICCDVSMDDDCTPADALEIFKEYLGMDSVCSF